MSAGCAVKVVGWSYCAVVLGTVVCSPVTVFAFSALPLLVFPCPCFFPSRCPFVRTERAGFLKQRAVLTLVPSLAHLMALEDVLAELQCFRPVCAFACSGRCECVPFCLVFDVRPPASLSAVSFEFWAPCLLTHADITDVFQKQVQRWVGSLYSGRHQGGPSS